jgi:hypothetical protein
MVHNFSARDGRFKFFGNYKRNYFMHEIFRSTCVEIALSWNLVSSWMMVNLCFIQLHGFEIQHVVQKVQNSYNQSTNILKIQ